MTGYKSYKSAEWAWKRFALELPEYVGAPGVTLRASTFHDGVFHRYVFAPGAVPHNDAARVRAMGYEIESANNAIA